MEWWDRILKSLSDTSGDTECLEACMRLGICASEKLKYDMKTCQRRVSDRHAHRHKVLVICTTELLLSCSYRHMSTDDAKTLTTDNQRALARCPSLVPALCSLQRCASRRLRGRASARVPMVQTPLFVTLLEGRKIARAVRESVSMASMPDAVVTLLDSGLAAAALRASQYDPQGYDLI